MTDVPIDYVAAGIALIDIQRRKKGPITEGWNEAANAITDLDRASELIGNVGVAHAYCSPAPTMALDVDDLPRAVSWLAARGVDLLALLSAGDSVQITSGRPDRAKLLFRLPPDTPPIETIVITEKGVVDWVEKDVTVIEFRCATRDGLTVQDVLPPSVHPDTGQPYTWAGNGHWTAIPEIPLNLLEVWQGEIEARAAKRRRKSFLGSTFSLVDDTPRKRALLSEWLNHISADCSYELYRNIVWSILSTGWHDAEIVADQWCQTAPDRYYEASFWCVVNSHDPSRSPTLGTICHHAKLGGWRG